MILGSIQQLQQQLEYTLQKPYCHSWCISKTQCDILEERYAIKLCFKLGNFREFRKRFRRKRPALFKSDQWHFQQDNVPVHYSILVTDYLTKICIKTVPHPPNCPDLAPCDFWLYPKLRGCCYETTEEMKDAVMKVIETLTQVDFHGASQKLLERYNKCIAAGGDYFKGGLKFHVCTINKSAHTKKVWKLIVCTSYVFMAKFSECLISCCCFVGCFYGVSHAFRVF